MRFSKWHALGNSYLVVEQSDAGRLTPARVVRLCSIETGIGSDGVLEVTGRDGTHAAVTIWNPDGSTAEMSGNGVRIAARWLATETGAEEVTISLTTAQERECGGKVVGVSLVVGEDGSLLSRRVISPASPACDAIAIEAVTRNRYKAARDERGRPIEGRFLLSIRF